jgi:formylglycine-generating enzyme required for sulfatase activity
MEYVEGEDYASRVKKGHKFTMKEILEVGESVGIALQMAWRHRIIHRDIKPSNILLTKTNETKVMDFGLAKDPESDLTASEVIMGTAKYMSPEQATGGQCDIRSDLYSLGVVLYELSAGRPPFSGEGATAIMYQHVHKAPPAPRQFNPEITEDIEKLILRLMAKDPQGRHQTPEALIADIQRIQDGVSPGEHQTLYDQTVKVEQEKPKTVAGGPAPAAEPAKTSNGKILGLLAAVALIGVAAYFVTRPDEKIELPAPPPPGTEVRNPAPPKPPPPKPEDPKPEPPKPPPPKHSPPTAAAWEEPKQKAEAAFAQKQWGNAAALFEEAIAKGAPELTGKLNLAKANDELERGDKAAAEGNDARALSHYELALKLSDEPSLRTVIQKLKCGVACRSAEKNEGKDWFKAADDWKKAIELAPETEVEELRVRQKYCSTFSEAVTAMLGEDWARSLGLWKELAKSPRGFAGEIGSNLKKAEEQIARMKAEDAVKARREFDAAVAAGQALRKNARWAEAKAKFEEASAPRFKEFPQEELAQGKEEVALALGAPPGMLYVPGGKFTMGGGRAVESPAGEASCVPVYMDEREVRVSEYVEFLKALDSFGHTPACAKAEPPNKKHTPLDWDAQKPEDPVAGVDWWDATSFAAWRKKRLPTEAEWEHAAGFDPAGRRLYPWGNRYQKEQGKSYLGLDGMSSGVIEWTSDWFKRYPWSSAEDPDFGEKRRVVRGGVLLVEDAPEATKVTFRSWYLPLYRSRKVGFRCVQDMADK